MLKLNLPSNILDKEAYNALPTHEKEEYIHNFLKQILELNPNGVTAPQIDNATYIGRSTVWHHLEILAARSQCFKVERGDTAVYHSNKVLEDLRQLDMKGDFYMYCFNVVENIFGKFVRMQLKQDTKAGNPRTNCGIVISEKYFDEFLDRLQKIKHSHLNEGKKSK